MFKAINHQQMSPKVNDASGWEGLKDPEILTGSFCPALFRWFARLAGPDGVARQDSELVLHPGTQFCHGSSQLVASHHLRDW